MMDLDAELGTKRNPIISYTIYLDKSHYIVTMNNNILPHADFVHCMAYDNTDKKGHSTIKFAQQGLAWANEIFKEQKDKFTLGLPFYGRSKINMEPMTYYDIAPHLKGKNKNITNVYKDQYFNSQYTLSKKIKMAVDAGVGGIMIWELGQDRQPFMQHKDSLMNGVLKALVKYGLTTRLDPDVINTESNKEVGEGEL